MLFKKVICLCLSEFIYYFSLIQVKIHYTFYRQQVHAQSSAAEHSATSLISHQPALHAYSVYYITLAIRISVMLSTNFIWWMLDYRDQGCKYITYIAYFCVVYKRVCISFGLGGGGVEHYVTCVEWIGLKSMIYAHNFSNLIVLWSFFNDNSIWKL